MNIGTLDLPLYKTSSYISLNEIPKERVLYEENFMNSVNQVEYMTIQAAYVR